MKIYLFHFFVYYFAYFFTGKNFLFEMIYDFPIFRFLYKREANKTYPLSTKLLELPLAINIPKQLHIIQNQEVRHLLDGLHLKVEFFQP